MKESKFDVSIAIIGIAGFFISLILYSIIPESADMFALLMTIFFSLLVFAIYRMHVRSNDINLVEKSPLAFSFFTMSILFLFITGLYLSNLYGNIGGLYLFILVANFLSGAAYLAYVGKRFKTSVRKKDAIFNPDVFGYFYGILTIIFCIMVLVLIYSSEMLNLSIYLIVSAIFAVLGGIFSPKNQETKANSDNLGDEKKILQKSVPELEQMIRDHERIKLEIKTKISYIKSLEISAVQTLDVQTNIKLQAKELKKLRKEQSALEKFIKKRKRKGMKYF